MICILAISFNMTSNAKGVRVRIMNIKPKYSSGMMLSEGKYDVEVFAAGYETKRVWVSHKKGHTTHMINLERSKII